MVTIINSKTTIQHIFHTDRCCQEVKEKTGDIVITSDFFTNITEKDITNYLNCLNLLNLEGLFTYKDQYVKYKSTSLLTGNKLYFIFCLLRYLKRSPKVVKRISYLVELGSSERVFFLAHFNLNQGRTCFDTIGYYLIFPATKYSGPSGYGFSFKDIRDSGYLQSQFHYIFSEDYFGIFINGIKKIEYLKYLENESIN